MSRSRGRQSSSIAYCCSPVRDGVSISGEKGLSGKSAYGVIVGNNPIKAIDPLGLHAEANYYVGDFNLKVTDSANPKNSASWIMASGSGCAQNNSAYQHIRSPNGKTGDSGPILVGDYRITSWEERPKGRPSFSLVPMDDTPNDRYVNVKERDMGDRPFVQKTR
ncbi:MAG: hypothetical protein RLZZ399_1152 [Verrucomicrobiota bacterium]